MLYFDAMDTSLPSPLDNKTYEKEPLVQDYPPEASSHHTYTWFVRKRPELTRCFE